MSNRFLDQKLSVKISVLGIATAAAAAVVLVALAVWQSGQYNALARADVDRLITSDLDHITQSVYNLVRTEDLAVQERIDQDLEVAGHLLAARGSVELAGPPVSWLAVDQLTRRETRVSLPRMLVGGRWLGQNRDPAAPTPVVDQIAVLTGASATLFQRMDGSGDMLRVATTVPDTDGSRAIGTYIPARNPDGSPNPVIEAVSAGATYHGRAYVVNGWSLTAYAPLTDAGGRLIGMLYVGIGLKNVESRIRDAILTITIGETGYVYVLGGTGIDHGRYVISQQGLRDGEDVSGNQDSDGNLVVQKIITEALSLEPGQLATERYRWQNPGEKTPRWKVARIVYYAPWDWVIGTSAYEDELQAYRVVLTEGRWRMIRTMVGAGTVLTLLVGCAGVLVALSIARPVKKLTGAVEAIIQGSLDLTVDVPTQDEIGTLASTFNVMTARLRQTLNGLRESEENFRAIFENALEGIFQMSADGRIMRASPALLRMLGHPSADALREIAGRPAPAIFERAEDGAAVIADAMEHGAVMGREVRLLRADRTPVWVSLSARLVRDDAEGTHRFQGFAIDITERKRAQAERETLIKRLETANAEMERFIYTVSHDLKSPLITIRGYAGWVEESARTGAMDRLREDVGRISSAAEKMQVLLDELLELSRIGHKPNPPVVTPFADVAREALDLLAGPLRQRGVRTVVEDGLPAVFGDRVRLREVVQNLVDNAVKFMGSQPDPVVRIGARVDEGRPVFFVEDNGIGIEPRFHAKVFGLFEKLDGGSAGSGAGLAIVQRIVELHGGRVWVESDGVGKGARFCFTLGAPAPGGTAI
jgi:PAS domain S-box-containing protein